MSKISNDTFADRRYIARAFGQDKVHCIICDEEIQLSDDEFGYVLSGKRIYKVCDKCKHAVMEMRKQLEKKKRKEKASAPNNICAMH